MFAYLKRNSRVMINLDAEEGEEAKEDEHAPQPSSGTKYKHAKKRTT